MWYLELVDVSNISIIHDFTKEIHIQNKNKNQDQGYIQKHCPNLYIIQKKRKKVKEKIRIQSKNIPKIYTKIIE